MACSRTALHLKRDYNCTYHLVPLERSRRRWQENIKMDFKERGWEDVGCTHLAQTAPLVGCCEHGNEPIARSVKAGKFLSS
jgi:hypothetical protein